MAEIKSSLNVFVILIMVALNLTVATKITCNYSPGRFHIVGDVYTCTITRLENEFSPGLEVSGEHRRHKTNFDVKFVTSEGIEFKAMPNGLERVFPNLIGIHLKHGKIRHLTQDNLKIYPNLVYLSLNMNDIEYLDSDVFEFNFMLEHISFMNNQLSSIGASTLKPLTKLHSAHFNSNPCIDGHAVTRNDIEKLIPILQANCKVKFEPAILRLEERCSILEKSLASENSGKSLAQPIRNSASLDKQFDQQNKKIKMLEEEKNHLENRILKLEKFIKANFPIYDMWDN